TSHLARILASEHSPNRYYRPHRTHGALARLMHRGGRYERVQDRDRAESTAANVATGGGGGYIVRRAFFGAGAGAPQDRLWRVAHRRAPPPGPGPTLVQPSLGPGDQPENRAARPSDQAYLLRRPDQRRDRARRLRQADRRR